MQVVDGEVAISDTIVSGKYDYWYMENGVRYSYKEKGLLHGVNDYEKISNVNNGKLVIGNILPNTSVNEFVSNLNFVEKRIKLYDNKNNLIYNYSNMDTGYNDKFDDKDNFAIGTGYRVETYSASNEKIEEFYLAVLGDVTGDGKINSQDVNYLRRVIADKTLYNSLSDKPYLLLAMLIDNRSALSNNDADILWSIICGKGKINQYI